MSTPATNPQSGSGSHGGHLQTATDPGQDRLWDYYQNEASDSFDLSLPRVAFLARRVRRIRPGAKVLNIGVGGGTFERAALAEGLDVHCLDPNERTIDRMRAEFGLAEKAQAGYSQEIPFGDASLDCVVMSEVLEHLEADVQTATLAEIDRVLTRGGRFLGTVPASEDLEQGRVVCPDCGSRFHRWGHLHSFDREKLGQLLQERFDLETIEERSFMTSAARSALGKLKGWVRRSLVRLKISTPSQSYLFFEAKKR